MKILCFGDSNTYGYDPRSCFGGQYPAECRWVDILANRLNCTVINAGENGREIPRREMEFNRFTRLLGAYQPVDLLIVMLGTNDLLQGNTTPAVAERMERFLEQIDLERSKILLMTPPPMKLGGWVPEQVLVDRSRELSSLYRVLSERLGIRYTDAVDVPLAYDGVHMTEGGHIAFAEHLISHLKLEDEHEQCQ